MSTTVARSRRLAVLRLMDHWVDPVLLLAAACAVPLIVVGSGSPTDADLRIVVAGSWTIWALFTANFVVRLAVSPHRGTEFRHLVWDLALILGEPLVSLGERRASPVLALVPLVVVTARAIRRGLVLRRTGATLRSHPIRVVAGVVPFVWLLSASLAYRAEAETGTITSFGDGLWWSAVTLATVGYGDISPESTFGRTVAVGTMVVGIGMFSVVTAKLAERLVAQRSGAGRREVLESGHTLIAGWSPKIFTVISELVEANRSRSGAVIVVLADRDSNLAHQEISSQVPALEGSGTTLVCRSGSPTDPTDLARCRPGAARAVVLMDRTEHEASVVRSLLALQQAGADLAVVPVIAEVVDATAAAAVRQAIAGRVTTVDPADFIARTAAQACRSGGIARAYDDLLSFRGAELYLLAVAGTAGRTYGEVAAGMVNACATGLRRGGVGAVELNPSPTTTIGDGDHLLVLADDDVGVVFDPVPVPPPGASAGPGPVRPEQVLVIGWNPLADRIVRELDGLLPAGSSITVVVDERLAAPPVLPEMAHATMQVHVAGGARFADLVAEVALPEVDHAMVLCDHRAAPADADAHALLCTLLLRQAFAACGTRPTLTTELRDERNAELAPPGSVGEFLVSDRLVSLLLAQLAEDDALAPVFDDLLDPAGADVSTRSPAEYGLGGSAVTWAEVLAAGVGRGESPVGWRIAALGDDADRGFGVTLNPGRHAPVTLGPADQILVVA